MAKPKPADLLIAQVQREAAASSFYLHAWLWCTLHSYEGSATFFRRQATEEREHMEKQLAYLTDFLSLDVPVPEIPEQALRWKSLQEVFQGALDLELQVTGFLNEIANAADEAGDSVTEAFLQWFLLEQIDSVSDYRTKVTRLQEAGSDVAAIQAFDDELNPEMLQPVAVA